MIKKIKPILFLLLICTQPVFGMNEDQNPKSLPWLDKACLFLFHHQSGNAEVYFSPATGMIYPCKKRKRAQDASAAQVSATQDKTEHAESSEEEPEPTYIPFQNRPGIRRPIAIKTDESSLKETRPIFSPKPRFVVKNPLPPDPGFFR